MFLEQRFRNCLTKIFYLIVLKKIWRWIHLHLVQIYQDWSWITVFAHFNNTREFPELYSNNLVYQVIQIYTYSELNWHKPLKCADIFHKFWFALANYLFWKLCCFVVAVVLNITYNKTNKLWKKHTKYKTNLKHRWIS